MSELIYGPILIIISYILYKQRGDLYDKDDARGAGFYNNFTDSPLVPTVLTFTVGFVATAWGILKLIKGDEFHL